MCRSIKVLRREPEEPVTPDEIQAAALQYVRKISGFHKPSKANEAAFAQAVEEIAGASRRLLDGVTQRASRKRAETAADQVGEHVVPATASTA